MKFTVKELPVNDIFEIDIEKMKYEFSKDKPEAVFCTHVSNVTGYVLPIEEIFGESKKQGSINILDSAQSMGLIDIRADLIKVDIIAFAGHKTLYGPFGIGGFINVSGIKLNTFITGGTGSDSLNLDMPSGNESKYESASANIVAIAGLNAALESLDQRKCYEHEKELTKYLIERLSNNKKVKMYLPNDLENHIGIVSLTVDGFSSEDIGIILDEDFDIAVRTGYHCAPYIHKYLKESVWKHLGDGKINAYKLWGNKEIEDIDQSLDGIVFCGLAKIMSIADSNPKLYERLKKDCRLIVFDEAHKAAAKKTQKVIECLMRMPEGYENRALIGLTATPGRTTEDSYDNNLLTNMFGNKLIYIDSDILNQINMGKLKALNTVAESNIIKYFQERRILAKMEPHKLTYKMEFSESELKILSSTLRDMGYDDKEYTESQLKVLARNKERNLAILACLRQLQIDKKPTIVFACSVDHAKMLAAMLTLEGIPNSLVLGEMDVMDRKRAINIFKNRNSGVDIIINYEVLTTGFDSKNIKCVFITRPTKSIVLYSQMLGRGLRGPLMGGNEECDLIDIDDNLQAFDNETAFSHFNDYWRV